MCTRRKCYSGVALLCLGLFFDHSLLFFSFHASRGSLSRVPCVFVCVFLVGRQAQARAHRIGQTKAVMVYRLLSKKTYEMHMFHQASLKVRTPEVGDSWSLLPHAVCFFLFLPSQISCSACARRSKRSLRFSVYLSPCGGVCGWSARTICLPVSKRKRLSWTLN